MATIRTNFGVAAPVRRSSRRPEHTFYVKNVPHAVTPFAIAPVLPGETLKGALLQVRAVLDPIKNPLIGWWLEHYIYYVKLTDLPDGAEYMNMLTKPTHALAAGVKAEAASVPWYHGGGTGSSAINWTKQCVEAIVNAYMRDENDLANDFVIDGYPAAQIKQRSWLDSASTTVEMDAVDLNVDINANASIMASEVEDAMRQWELSRLHGMTELTYEEYLQQAGVKVDVDVIGKPELIRASSNWQYPVNTVDPLTGTPSSAASWAITERADKDRYFREPGFIVGVTVARPKVYLSKKTGSLVQQMNDAHSWLPAVLRQDFDHAFKKLVKTWGVVNGQTNDLWIDVRDLLLYGDQFVNFALTGSTSNPFALPTAALQKKYPAAADIDALFVTPLTKKYCNQDGKLDLMIQTSVKDVSPTT